MRWRGAQTTIATALTVLMVAVVGWPAATGTGHDASAGAATGSDPSGHAPLTGSGDSPSVYATVDATLAGSPLAPGFLGVSLEYSALEAYTGGHTAVGDPVFVQLLRNLGHPVLRIGGNSTDATWWPVRGMGQPASVRYVLTPQWMASARALSAALGTKLILGVNLAAGRPRLSAAEARALVRGVGAGNIAALELGNEPDVYGVFPWYRAHHRPVFARSAGYGLSGFLGDARRASARLPRVALAGPATAELSWLPGLRALTAAEPGLRLLTVHRYPIQGCLEDRRSPSYPSIANLLSERASAALAQGVIPYATFAHAHGLQFRVDELNSAALAGCLGRAGVTNTFASALWMLDALFEMASVGVDGVNVHTLPGAGYELFTFHRAAGGWRAFVHPDYYGMLMFAEAFPQGARLLSVHAPAGPVKVWATRAADGRTRVALINKDARPHRVELQLPFAAGEAQLEWLRSAGAGATSGVSLGGQTFGLSTDTGRLPAPRPEPISQLFGWYSVQMPADSAALLVR